MLILILIDVHYSQKVVFSIEKDSNDQNHSSPGSHSAKFEITPLLPYAVATVYLQDLLSSRH